jgi:hypothetical protein
MARLRSSKYCCSRVKVLRIRINVGYLEERHTRLEKALLLGQQHRLWSPWQAKNRQVPQLAVGQLAQSQFHTTKESNRTFSALDFSFCRAFSLRLSSLEEWTECTSTQTARRALPLANELSSYGVFVGSLFATGLCSGLSDRLCRRHRGVGVLVRHEAIRNECRSSVDSRTTKNWDQTQK